MYPPFDYVRVKTVSEALRELGPGSKVIAGGTDLMVSMRRGEVSPEKLVDVSFVDEIRGIRRNGGRLWIGSATTHEEVECSSLLRKKVPFLPAASGSVGGPQIRCMGTIGGNVVNASPAADTVPPLVCLGAEVVVVGEGGKKRIPVKEFITGPYKTSLGEREIVEGLEFDLPGGDVRTVFLKVARRSSMAISRISLAVLAEFEGGFFKRLRISLGSVSPRPFLFEDKEGLAVGSRPSKDVFREVARRVSGALKEISGDRPSFVYKGPVVEGLVIRALSSVSGGV